MKQISLILTILTVASCNNASENLALKLESKNDSGVTGTINFSKQGNKVTLKAVLEGATQGNYAIHIHEKSDCSSADGKSAGGHWNPTLSKHGKWGSAEGYHRGDVGNIVVNEKGEGSLTLSTDEWCIGCGDEKKNIVGKAIIIHQGQDDFTTQPTGNAGSRISCGAIIK